MFKWFKIDNMHGYYISGNLNVVFQPKNDDELDGWC